MSNFNLLPSIKNLVVVASTILIVNACNAQPPEEDGINKVPIAKGIASKTEKVAPQDKITPRPLNDELSENQMRPPPCSGIATGLVSPRVQKFLTCDLIKILAKPDSVQSFKVKPVADISVPEKERLGNYPIEPNGAGAFLNTNQLQKLQGSIFSEKSYIFGVEKRCRFRPEIGLHFVKGNESVEILFSFACDLWLFVHKDEQKLEDFDPIHNDLVQLYNSLFPISNTPTTQD